MLEVKFSFKDEFEQVTALEKTFTEDTLEIKSQFEILFEEFKCFLRSMGHTEKTINSIQIVEENEQK